MISEEKMSIEFQKAIYNGHSYKIIPKYDVIFKEVESLQGIPDYIGIKFKTIEEKNNLKRILNIKIDYLSYVSLLLPYIKKNALHSENYFASKTGLNITAVRKTLNYLQNESIIMNKGNKYILENNLHIPEMEIWSFELKLKNWKRAIFQSLRYKAFSDYVYIVMPMECRNIIEQNKKVFLQYNIGVMLFNHIDGTIEISIRALKNKKISKSNTIFILGRLLEKFKDGDRVKN
jgi:hypothetical protein